MSGVPLNISLTQILLHLLNFAILFLVLYFLIYRPVKAYMEKREAAYAGERSETNEALKAAEESREEHKKRLKNAEAEIRAMKEKARADSEAQRLTRVNEAREEASGILTKAKEEAELERARILSEAEGDIAGLAAEAAGKLAFNASASEAFDSFLDAAEREA